MTEDFFANIADDEYDDAEDLFAAYRDDIEDLDRRLNDAVDLESEESFLKINDDIDDLYGDDDDEVLLAKPKDNKSPYNKIIFITEDEVTFFLYGFTRNCIPLWTIDDSEAMVINDEDKIHSMALMLEEADPNYSIFISQ